MVCQHRRHRDGRCDLTMVLLGVEFGGAGTGIAGVVGNLNCGLVFGPALITRA